MILVGEDSQLKEFLIWDTRTRGMPNGGAVGGMGI